MLFQSGGMQSDDAVGDVSATGSHGDGVIVVVIVVSDASLMQQVQRGMKRSEGGDEAKD